MRFLALFAALMALATPARAQRIDRFDVWAEPRTGGRPQVLRVCASGRIFAITATAGLRSWSYSRMGGDIQVGTLDPAEWKALVAMLRDDVLPRLAAPQRLAVPDQDAGRLRAFADGVRLEVTGSKALIRIDPKGGDAKLADFLARAGASGRDFHPHKYTNAACDGGQYEPYERFTPLDMDGRWRWTEMSGLGAHKEGVFATASLWNRYRPGYCEWFCGAAFGVVVDKSLSGPRHTSAELQVRTLTPLQLGVGVGPVFQGQGFEGGREATVFVGYERGFVDHSWQMLSLYHRVVRNDEAEVSRRETGVTYKFPLVFGTLILGLALAGGPG